MNNPTFQMDKDVQDTLTKAVRNLRRSMIITPLFLILITYIRIRSFKNPIALNHLTPIVYFAFLYIVLLILFAVFLIPIRKIKRIGRTIYAINLIENNTVEFYLFNISSNNSDTITCKKEDIIIDQKPLKSKQLNIYTMNTITIDGKKYEIFHKLIEDSNLSV
ncbi:hypothetical protein [Rhizosphaericola mali]|uniref:Uncharacterized protein n=1 Tax=Rhizosphaericola mali TaxID=2545455 RepID=A0A5P2GDQ1_9BACT|nr:hypothetical protein [Rhizosphaericola mali]QES89731.1 hypothetical protein E0W69_014030 [Rhizosphaericola mali]